MPTIQNEFANDMSATIIIALPDPKWMLTPVSELLVRTLPPAPVRALSFAPQTWLHIPNLAVGVPVSFAIQAQSALGVGPLSAPSIPVTPWKRALPITSSVHTQCLIRRADD